MLMKMVSLHCKNHGFLCGAVALIVFFVTHTLENLKENINSVPRKYRHEGIFANLCILSPERLQAS